MADVKFYLVKIVHQSTKTSTKEIDFRKEAKTPLEQITALSGAIVDKCNELMSVEEGSQNIDGINIKFRNGVGSFELLHSDPSVTAIMVEESYTSKVSIHEIISKILDKKTVKNFTIIIEPASSAIIQAAYEPNSNVDMSGKYDASASTVWELLDRIS